MSPAKKKATSARHAKAKRAARRSRSRATSKRPAKSARRRDQKLHAGAPRRESAGVKGRRGRGGPEGIAARVAGASPGGPVKQDAPRPKLAVVARPAPPKPKRRAKRRSADPVREFAGAKAGATMKDLALFGLERSRVAVHAAIQGLGAGAANQPIAPGKWTARQMVLHIAFWDREIVQKHLELAAARNQRADIHRSHLDAMNRAGVEGLEHHDWEAAKRLLQSTYEALWDAFDSIPAEPAEVWALEHAVGELVREVTDHDRHHADVIKRWRAQSKT
jgi:hypothetical protein